MSKPRRNKALQVLDARAGLVREERQAVAARWEALNATLKELAATRDFVAKAYERKPKAVKTSAHAKAAKLLDDAAAKAMA